MSDPTPASMKKMHDEKRASSPTPPVKDSRKSKESSSNRRAKRVKRSESTPESAGKVRSGKSNSSTEVSGTTEPGRQNSRPKRTKSGDAQKKPFVMKKHLTQRPFKNHEGLDRLKNTLMNSKPGKNQQIEGNGRATKDSTKSVVARNKENN